MPNMSHCRFQNTLGDLRDCEEALNEIVDLGELSTEEQRAAETLIKLCGQINADFGEVED